MDLRDMSLTRREKAVFGLRALYASLGYAPYKMSKFEEYELYVRNKSFLVSDNVITFNDTNGRLLALKPDVTLSIVKNTKDEPDSVQKMYYNENVYRTSASSQEFREIPQVGLECIGAVDDYLLCEVLLLAARSLALLSPDFVLELSHLDVVAAALDAVGATGATRAALLDCIGEKNAHDIDRICRDGGVDEAGARLLGRLVSTGGQADRVLAELGTMAEQLPAISAPVAQLERLVGTLLGYMDAEHLRLELSLVSDMNYYNGIVFCGYIKGVPTAVLSGGQYDGLMQRMGKRSRAVGFAVYLDTLEALTNTAGEYDVDTVLLYDELTPLTDLMEAVRERQMLGERVLACRRAPQDVRCRRTLKWDEKEA